MNDCWQKELTVALSAVRKAAELCQAVQASITPEVLDKKDHSPVTIADFASQAVICQAIGAAFPDNPIIAEEDSAALHLPENQQFLRDIYQLINSHGYQASASDICHWIDQGGAAQSFKKFWTLDPIDGTKGFVRGDQYAISLALFIDGELQIGVLGCPNFSSESRGQRSLFYAVMGQGAYVCHLDRDDPPQRIHVSATVDPALARFCESYESSHSSHSESAMIAERLGIKTPPLRMDSQAKYAALACGEADIYLRLPSKPGYFEKIWDHAGGVLVAQEAGGRVTDLNGKPLDFSLGRELRSNRGIIVTNGPFHDEVLAAAQLVVAQKSAAG